MHVRLINEADSVQVIDLMYEIHSTAQYAQGHAPLNSDRVASTIVKSLTMPYRYPCFVHEGKDGELTGMLYGLVEDTLFGTEKWFYERVFYIRPDRRSFPLMRAYVTALHEWARAEGICRIEFGNAFAPSGRLSLLYKRMGFRIVNTVYARRV